MAGFGMVMAALLFVGALISGALLVAGIAGSQPETKATVADPWTVPGLAIFRASEHEVVTPSAGDPWTAPGLAAFRASEHQVVTPWRGDPYAAPSLVMFRQSEHTEVR